MAKHPWSRPRRRVQEHPYPGEGGWGVVVVIASHLIAAWVQGLVSSLGVFYLRWKDEFDTNAKETAAVQSAMWSFMCFSSTWPRSLV